MAHLLSSEGARALRVDATYDYVYFDEMVTDATLLALASQSTCAVPQHIHADGFLLLPAACLVDQSFTVDGVTFGFRRVAAP
jgi:hypothetical protein